MNQKTEPEMTAAGAQEFSPSFLRWLTALTVATLTFLFATERIGLLKPHQELDSLHRNSLPWVTAGGIVIQQGLSMFSGKEPQPATHDQKHWMLGILLMGFVVSPTILLFSLRAMTLQPPKSPLSVANIGFYLGIIVSSFFFLSTLIMSIVQPQVAVSMRKAQALGDHRDQMIADLSHIAFEAIQYRILPRSSGGGARSYGGYEISPRLKKTIQGEYSQIETKDTTLVILGSSTLYPGSAIKATYGKNGTLVGAFNFMGDF